MRIPTFQNGYQLKLPLNLECIISEDDSVRLLSQFVEEMDLTDLYSTYERLRENFISPRTLLKIVLYSYMNGDYSSRSMEHNCKRDIDFMFLLEGAKAPDHATFARFRSIHFASCSKRILAEMSNRLYGSCCFTIFQSLKRQPLNLSVSFAQFRCRHKYACMLLIFI